MIIATGRREKELPHARCPDTLSDVSIVELSAESVLLGEAVALLDRIQAEEVAGPTAPWHASEVAATWRTSAFDRWICAAVDGGRVVGAASAVLLNHANSHLVDIEIVVDHGHRRRGLGSALWLRACRAAADHGADTLAGSIGERVTEAAAWRRHEAAIADPDLSVSSPAGTPTGRAFAASVGAEQVQTELLSRLDLPGAASPGSPSSLQSVFAPLDEQVADRARDYAVSTHVGLPPGDVRAGVARLVGRMNTDPPLGRLDIRPDDYSTERLEAGVDANLAGGQRTLWAVAVHRRTGEVAAMTDLLFRSDEPRWAHQEDTIVDPPHRGHRLGLAVKAAALRRLVAEHSQVRHIHTWNALENGPMLAVNRVMGYRPVSLVAIVQHKI